MTTHTREGLAERLRVTSIDVRHWHELSAADRDRLSQLLADAAQALRPLPDAQLKEIEELCGRLHARVKHERLCAYDTTRLYPHGALLPPSSADSEIVRSNAIAEICHQAADALPRLLAMVKGLREDNLRLVNDLEAEGVRLEALQRALTAAQESAQFYRDQYSLAVKASMDVFQCGGPLHDLLTLGQSTLLNGPEAAAQRIAELERQLTAARQAERERCAKVMDEEARRWEAGKTKLIPLGNDHKESDWLWHAHDRYFNYIENAKRCAAAIRSLPEATE